LKSFLITILLFAMAQISCAQTSGVRGKVTDEQGHGLPFTSMYIKGTTIGTASNMEGKYSLSLDPGKYQLVYQYVGYKTVIKQISIGEAPLELNVILEPDVRQLKEVVVKAGEEDPAYRVIRNAIKKRKYHLNEVVSYHCNVYIKGLQRLTKVPEKILGFDVPIDTGIVYFSESVSEFSVQRPNKIKEKLISSKVSGNNRAFSWNNAATMLTNFYKNNLYVEGLTERHFISPIAQNALLFYKYKLVGLIQEGDILINKIQVIPKRKNDPVFSGLIYIIEDQWRIHSLDLMITKDNGIEFVDSLTVNQVYAPVQNGYWMKFSQRYTFQFGVLGFEGNGNFMGVYSEYQVNPDLPKKYFNNEINSIQEGANKRDSAYWARIRPIPLTNIETEDYRVKDSIRVIKDSEPYKDSIDAINNKMTIPKILFAGYTNTKSFYNRSLGFDPIINFLQFNTVEGFVPNLNITYTKRFENETYYEIVPTLRYGFSSETFYGKLRVRYSFKPIKFAYAEITAGKFIAQYNHENPISPFINTFETLMLGKNYLKLYEKSFVQLKHRRELANGLMLTTALEYAERKELQNNTDYTFFEDNEGKFTSNIPDNTNLTETSFNTHQALLLDLNLKINFSQKYISRVYRKFILGSKYPTVTLKYRTAIDGIFGSDIRYDHLAILVNDQFRLGLLGSSAYMLTAGMFTNSQDVTLIDFNHFSGNRTAFANFELGNFQLLDYYFYSTTDNYYTGHYQHHFNGFIFNKLPLLRKLKFQTVGSVNFLYTEATQTYFEVGLGIEHILKIVRVDYFTSFLDGSQKSTGIRIGIGF